MATKYFGNENGSFNQLPFFSDWYENLPEVDKDFFEGWKFVVFDFKYSVKSGKGYTLQTGEFRTFMFKSHPFIKTLESPTFEQELRNKILCVEVRASEQWRYVFCLEDEVNSEWDVSESGDKGCVIFGTCINDRKLIINTLPPVPSLLPNTPQKQRKSRGNGKDNISSIVRGQEGTGGSSQVG